MKLPGWLLLFAGLMPAADLQFSCWGFLNVHEAREALPQEKLQEIQRGHLEHMARMAAAGRLLAAGPLATPGGPRGLVVYQCDSAAQAVEWASPDSAVVHKRLRVEMYRWKSFGRWGEPLAAKMKADPSYQPKMVQLPFAIVLRTEKSADGALPPREAREAHVAYSLRLVEEGKLRSFGSFEEAPDKLGVLIYAAMPLDDARKLAENDPLVKVGWGKPAMHVWHVADEAVPRR